MNCFLITLLDNTEIYSNQIKFDTLTSEQPHLTCLPLNKSVPTNILLKDITSIITVNVQETVPDLYITYSIKNLPKEVKHFTIEEFESKHFQDTLNYNMIFWATKDKGTYVSYYKYEKPEWATHIICK